MSQRAVGRRFALGALILFIGSTIPSAQAFPAFARKYGLRCTACHEAWPVLNDFGRAFRDNGYQMMTREGRAHHHATGLHTHVDPHYPAL